LIGQHARAAANPPIPDGSNHAERSGAAADERESSVGAGAGVSLSACRSGTERASSSWRDPTRRRIIALLAVSACRPSTIAREIGRSRPAVSRQLALLVDAGLVERRPAYFDGRAILYRIAADSHGPITAWLAGTNVGRPIRLRLDANGKLHEG